LEQSKQDTIGYTLFYLYQRLELIFNKSVEMRLDPIVHHIISIFGKIALEVTRLDITLTQRPLELMGKLALKGQKRGMEEAASRTVLTFLEIGRVLTEEIDITYLEIKDPFVTMVRSITEIEKELFRHDKTIPVAMLVAPLEQMKGYFGKGKASEHQDKGEIIRQIDLALQEFKILEEVLRAVPDLESLKKSLGGKGGPE
jgi:hypothetical protein